MNHLCVVERTPKRKMTKKKENSNTTCSVRESGGQVVAEIQLVHAKLMLVRENLGAHDVYDECPISRCFAFGLRLMVEVPVLRGVVAEQDRSGDTDSPVGARGAPGWLCSPQRPSRLK